MNKTDKIVYEILRDSLLEYSLAHKNKEMFMNLTSSNWMSYVVNQSFSERIIVTAQLSDHKSNKKTYKGLMASREAEPELWPVYTDVICPECNKVQSLANYRSNDSKCVKCNCEVKI